MGWMARLPELTMSHANCRPADDIPIRPAWLTYQLQASTKANVLCISASPANRNKLRGAHTLSNIAVAQLVEAIIT